MLDRRLITHFDFGFLFLVLLISLIGEGAIYSASHFAGSPPSDLYLRQLYWIGIGLILLLATISIDYRSLHRYAYLIYAVSVGLLLVVSFKGAIGMGAQRWIVVGPLTLQPSELAKIALILVLSRYLSDIQERGGFTAGHYFNLALLIGLPLILILRQPDLGTSLMLLFIAVTLLFLAGMPVRFFTYAGVTVLGAVPFLWRFLKDYQKQRIRVFFNPDLDPSGAGYHIIQSKIAIGSGGFLGKGIMHGTQSQLRFLPEQHTDFIFSVIAEETGFIGTLILILLFAYLIFKGINIALKTQDLFGTLVATGITTMIAYYILINIGMTSGLFPVVGVPLPFISYGGSSLITLFIGVGLILNIRMRRFHEG
ncbi:MAG: rod shape-determining protein RodA [Deltaproteobacteria bacterium]|nr:rod shape-determining protein RodA [Deltaproteobacteria bacterium]